MRNTRYVPHLIVGYARVSSVGQDLAAQCEALSALGVDLERMYTDRGLAGAHCDRPGLREALAACRSGDTFVVSKLDRLARSVPDARDIVDGLAARGVQLNVGGSLHDPSDPVGRLLPTVLSMIAEFEADVARSRTREGMAIARAKGRLRGRQPKLSPTQQADLVALYQTRQHTIDELGQLFGVTRSTIYRTIRRADRPAQHMRVAS